MNSIHVVFVTEFSHSSPVPGKPVLQISPKSTENEQQLLFLAYRFIRWDRFAVMHPNCFCFSSGLVFVNGSCGGLSLLETPVQSLRR